MEETKAFERNAFSDRSLFYCQEQGIKDLPDDDLSPSLSARGAITPQSSMFPGVRWKSRPRKSKRKKLKTQSWKQQEVEAQMRAAAVAAQQF